MQFKKVNDDRYEGSCPAGDQYALQRNRNGSFTIYMNGKDFSVRGDLQAAKDRANEHAQCMPGTRARLAKIKKAKELAAGSD